MKGLANQARVGSLKACSARSFTLGSSNIAHARLRALRLLNRLDSLQSVRWCISSGRVEVDVFMVMLPLLAEFLEESFPDDDGLEPKII